MKRALFTLVTVAACFAGFVSVTYAQQLSVAVVPFANRSGQPDSDALAKGLADMLITDLSVSPEIRLIERERLAAITAELKLGTSGMVDKKTAAKIGKLLGADALLLGSMKSIAPNLRLDARLVAVETGEVMATAKASGKLSEFFAVESRLAIELLKAFGAKLNPLQRLRIAKAPTKKLAALKHYSRGLDASDRGDEEAAKSAFSRALAADSGFSKAQQRLDALAKRVQALEKRTEAVERAGGVILAPKTAIEFWSNAKIHLARGADPAALSSMQSALKLAPIAVDVLLAYAKARKAAAATGAAPRWPKAVPKRLQDSADAIISGIFRTAEIQTRLSDTERDSSTKGTATVAAAVWLRVITLAPPTQAQATAQERAELAMLVRGTPRADVFVDPSIAAAQTKRWLQRRAYFAEQLPTIGPILSVSRRSVVASPVVVSLRPFGGRWKPPFMLRVTIAEANATGCAVTLKSAKRGKDSKDGGAVQLERVRSTPLTDEVTVFETEAPRPIPVGTQSATVTYTNLRGEPVSHTASFLFARTSRVGGNRENLAFGSAHVSKYPLLMTRFAAWEKADQGGQLLVDAAAGIWTLPTPEFNRFNMAVLEAGTTTAFAVGTPIFRPGTQPGSQFAGLQRRLIYRAGGGVVADATALYGVQTVEGERHWLSASQSTARESGYPLFDPVEGGIAGETGKSIAANELEVTVDQYRACVAAGVCQPLLGASCMNQRGHAWPNQFQGDQATGCLPVTPNPYPVTGVLHRQAKTYCRWIGGDLPSWSQWRKLAGVSSPTGDNFLDAITCEWTRYGRKPRECEPSALRKSNEWDGHGWIAPVNTSSRRVLGNVREWLATDGWSAGCSFNEPMGASCRKRRNVEVLASPEIGFRCVGGAPPRTGKSKRRTPLGKPALRWKAIAAGGHLLGGPEQGTSASGGAKPLALSVELNGETPATDDQMERITRALIGVPPNAARAMIKTLSRGGLPIEVTLHHLQELFSRGRWAGLARGDVVQTVASYGDGKLEKKRVKEVFDVYITRKYALERWRRKHRRDLADNAAMSPAEQRTALFTKLLGDIGSHFRVPPSEDSPRFDDRRGYSCIDQPNGKCIDRTGVRGTRLDIDRHVPRLIELRAFKMLQTEVTQAQFKAAMGYVPSFFDCPDCAADRVTHGEASAFCAKVGGRLPSEAQWERAASLGARDGHAADLNDDVAWHGNSKRAPDADGKDDNEAGLHGLIGGVWEWTADAWDEGKDIARMARYLRVPAENEARAYRAPTIDMLRKQPEKAPPGRACLYGNKSYLRTEGNLAKLPWKLEKNMARACFGSAKAALDAYSKAFTKDPTGPVADPDAHRAPQRVLKGGSWRSDERLLTTYGRIGYQADQRHDFVGFRCVK